MDWKIVLPLLVTAVITMSGWFVGHRVSTWKDRKNKKRDLTTTYLIECFRRIEYASNRDLDEFTQKQLEATMADIQLFGSTDQIAAARAFVEGIASEDHSATPIPLLHLLRNDLRQELELPFVDVPLFFWRRIGRGDTQMKPPGDALHLEVNASSKPGCVTPDA